MATRREAVWATASPVPAGGGYRARCPSDVAAVHQLLKIRPGRRWDRPITGNQSGGGEPLESFMYREGEGPTALLEGGPGSLEMSFTQPKPVAARGLGALLFPS